MIRPCESAVVPHTSRMTDIMAPTKRTGRSCPPDSVIRGPEHAGKLWAVLQTAGQAGSYVWVTTLKDFTSGELRRSIVFEENFATAAAAKDAGNARLKATAEEKQADH